MCLKLQEKKNRLVKYFDRMDEVYEEFRDLDDGNCNDKAWNTSVEATANSGNDESNTSMTATGDQEVSEDEDDRLAEFFDKAWWHC